MLLRFELLFESLRDGGRSYAFPCDGNGHVDMDTMTPRALNEYLFARACIGLELARPSIREVHAANEPMSAPPRWGFR